MGDKATAKATMKAAGVPVVPGSDGIIPDFKTCQKLAKEAGYPVNAIEIKVKAPKAEPFLLK